MTQPEQKTVSETPRFFPGQEVGSQRVYDTVQILQWHVLLRIVVSFFILFSTIAFHFSENLSVFYGLIGANVLVTLLSAFFIGSWHENPYFVWSQILWDILFVSALIYVSGGIGSLFSFMYILSVINTSILLDVRGTLFCSGFYFFSYSAIVAGHFFGWIQPLHLDAEPTPVGITGQELVFRTLLNGLGMLVAAWLANQVTRNAKSMNKRLRQKQVDLEELKALNEHIVQSTNIGILTLAEDETITFANQSAHRFFGRILDEKMGEPVDRMFPALKLDRDDRGIPREIMHGEDDQKSFYNVSAAALTDDGGRNIGWTISFQDVSDIRRMEEEVKRADRLAAVGKLASGIAHEIRNPLASMSGSIQLLRNELDLDQVNQHLMDIVVREMDRLNLLITDFLVFARPPKIDPEVVDLGAMLSETLGMLRNDPMCRAGIAIKEGLDQGLFVHADSDLLKQMFWNLLTNAIQAMPEGGKLEIAGGLVEKTNRNEPAVMIRITDTGIGMGEKTLKSIFDPFYTTKQTGSGLGLTSAYRIVENHKGRIWCESEKNVGTSFFVVLPRL
jgi:two-component system, NtrC family, sensor histidine kinase PilS